MWQLLQIELLKIFRKPRTYISFGAIAAMVMLEVVRTVDGIVTCGGEPAQFAGVHDHIGVAAGVDVEKVMLPAGEMARNRNGLAAAADIENGFHVRTWAGPDWFDPNPTVAG